MQTNPLRNSIIICSLLLSTIVFLVYLGNLEGRLYLDDFSNLVEQERVTIDSLSFKNLWLAFSGVDGVTFSRGLTMVTFALNYHFADHQLWSWHLVNNLIHVLCALLLFLLILKLCEIRNLGDRVLRPWWLMILALYWGLNPLHTQAVTYVVQRLTLLATIFCLSSVICWIYWFTGQENADVKYLLFSHAFL